MSWKERFKYGFDFNYEAVKREYPDIKYPCYGGRFYYHSINYPRKFEELYFYMTSKSLIYARGCTNITEIPFKIITNVSIVQGRPFKSSYHVRFNGGGDHHFIIKDMSWLSTELTGNNADNLKGFFETLREKC